MADKATNGAPEFNFAEGSERQVFEWDHAEARGKIAVERGHFGLFIYVEGQAEPVALVDLFYRSPEGQAVEDPLRRGNPQLVVYDNVNHGEAVAYVHFTPEGPRVEFEVGAGLLKRRSGDPAVDTVFGYPHEQVEEVTTDG